MNNTDNLHTLLHHLLGLEMLMWFKYSWNYSRLWNNAWKFITYSI